MKMIVAVVLALVAITAALPLEEPIKIIKSEYEQSPEGSYSASFETENGIRRQEHGVLKSVLDEENKPHDVIVVEGQYSYLRDDGNTETISYSADEGGFHAEGPSIPKAPARR